MNKMLQTWVWGGVLVALLLSGCKRPAVTPTLSARPETLPTATPTPVVPALTSPLASPLTPPARFPMQVAVPANAEKAVLGAVADLSERLGIKTEQVVLVSVESVQWPDASLGCPQPGMMYAQVITPGYLIVLEAKGQRYPYHAGERGDAIFCPAGQKPLPNVGQ